MLSSAVPNRTISGGVSAFWTQRDALLAQSGIPCALKSLGTPYPYAPDAFRLLPKRPLSRWQRCMRLTSWSISADIFSLVLRRPSATGREAVARALGLHEYGCWEESGIHRRADGQIEDEEDPLINGQLAHLILEVAHARVDSRAALAPRAGRLPTEQRTRCDQEENS